MPLIAKNKSFNRHYAFYKRQVMTLVGIKSPVTFALPDNVTENVEIINKLKADKDILALGNRISFKLVTMS